MKRPLLIRAAVALCAVISLATSAAFSAEPVDIGSRRELFVDRFLIDKLTNTELRLHAPQHAGAVMRYDKPWEGPFGAYSTVIKDGPVYRMYYRGMPVAEADGSKKEITCCAESRDGANWTKPKYGLFEIAGTKENNVVVAKMPPFSHNFAPMLDARPGVSADERYKAVAGLDNTGLVAFASPDGVRWRKLREQAVITKKDIPIKHNWLFDSQNVAFWSEAEACYVCYFRVYDGRRRIARTTSKDFLTWTPAVLTEQFHDDGSGTPKPAPADEHLYTNQTTPYFRAPHIYIALPSRFMDGRDAVTQEQKTQLGVDKSYFPPGSGFNDMPLMTSRGGNRYDRTFLEAWIRPGPGLKNWTSRANYPACGVVPTPPENPTEISIYVDREVGYPTSHVARYTLRLDGFVSVNAPYTGGEMITRPLKFSGAQLAINFATSAVGAVRVEIQDAAAGKPIPGFALEDCAEVIGDETDRVVAWKNGSDVSKLEGEPVRLRFVMRDADLYAVQFRPAVR